MMAEIKSKQDIICFVNAFYTKVQQDDLLGPIFNGRIESEKWPLHLEKMYRFWNSALFGVSEYRGHPFSHHIHLPIQAEHFEKWVALFSAAIREKYAGDKAEEAIVRAQKMGQMFELKLERIRANPNYRPLL